MPVRFGILSAVSTDAQATEDKGSLDDQIRTCRASVSHLGGVVEAVYLLDGFSRTGYDSLAEAMTEIPPLGQAVRDAEADKYDVLILDNFDRLGDLGILLSNRFKKLKKQLYSARQSGRLQDPATYDPYNDESTDIGIGVGFLLQKYRLAKIRRGYDLGMSKRVESGKYGLRHPKLGYINKGKHAPLEIDPATAPIIIALKDELLRGATIREIERRALALGLVENNGKTNSMYKIFQNPFYAGKVFHGYKSGKNPDALRDGNHPALWTWDEHLQIKSELERRYRSCSRYNPKMFSGLFRCSVCNKKVWYRDGVWRCTYPGKDHITMPDTKSFEIVVPELVQALKNYRDDPAPAPVNSLVEEATIQKKIEKIQKGYEAGIYNVSQAQEKIDKLKSQLKEMRDFETKTQIAEASRRRFVESREAILAELDNLPEALRLAPAKESNTYLHSIISKIILTPIVRGEKYQVMFEWV